MVPDGWKVRKLSEVAYIQTGIAKGKKGIADPIKLPYLRVANVQDGYLDLTEIKQITVSRQQIERYCLQEGDVLLTEGGDFDKLGRGYIWHGQIEPCLHQNHVFAVRTKKSILMPEFLSIQASSSYGKKYFLSCAKQTTNLATINSTQLKDFPVLIPPLPEQQKIAAILDSVDEAIASTQAVIDQTRKVKQGLLQQLLTRGIGHTKFKHSAIGKIPECWNVKTAQDVCFSISVGVVVKPSQYYVEFGIPCFRSANVREGYIRDDDWVYISEESNEILSKSKLRTGDVLVVRSGYPGTSCVVSEKFDGTNCIDIIFARPNSELILSEYLSCFINSSLGKKQVLQSQGGLAQQHFNVGALNSMKISIPPLEEQNKIVKILSKHQESILHSEEELKNLLKIKRGLMQDLLTGRVRVGGTP
jgi:type I restriction enzyme S subunit